MTDDLVTWLRRTEDELYGATRCREAADRIEKLEAALKFLIKCEEFTEAAAKASGQTYVNKGLDFARELVGMDKKDD
jgi:hypothetical protein